MNTPSIHTPTEIQHWQCARCIGFDLSFFHPRRWKIAWRVLTGRYDALDWSSVEIGTPSAKELERMVKR